MKRGNFSRMGYAQNFFLIFLKAFFLFTIFLKIIFLNWLFGTQKTISVLLYDIPGPNGAIQFFPVSNFSIFSVIEKLKSWKLPDYHVEERIEKSADQWVLCCSKKNIHPRCSVINELFLFNKRPLSDEEANFPLAYGLVVYKQITQVYLWIFQRFN